MTEGRHTRRDWRLTICRLAGGSDSLWEGSDGGAINGSRALDQRWIASRGHRKYKKVNRGIRRMDPDCGR